MPWHWSCSEIRAIMDHRGQESGARVALALVFLFNGLS
jgi:hypothetical protein